MKVVIFEASEIGYLVRLQCMALKLLFTSVVRSVYPLALTLGYILPCKLQMGKIL